MGRSQLTLWPLAWGDGEVSLELGSEATSLRARLEGGANRGLLGVLASLAGSFWSINKQYANYREEEKHGSTDIPAEGNPARFSTHSWKRSAKKNNYIHTNDGLYMHLILTYVPSHKNPSEIRRAIEKMESEKRQLVALFSVCFKNIAARWSFDKASSNQAIQAKRLELNLRCRPSR